MRFSSIVLGLAAAVSAIDIRGHDQDICRGGYVACVNIDPNVCCTFDGKASIWVAAVRDVPSLLNPSPLLQFPIYEKKNTSQKEKEKENLTCRNESTQIPPAWRIRARSMTGGGCSYLATEGDNNGTQDICLAYTSRGLRTGARYWFLNLKRAEDETCPAAQPEGGKCEASVKPNVLGLADGTEYNIEGLSDEKVAEMVSSFFVFVFGALVFWDFSLGEAKREHCIPIKEMGAWTWMLTCLVTYRRRSWPLGRVPTPCPPSSRSFAAPLRFNS